MSTTTKLNPQIFASYVVSLSEKIATATITETDFYDEIFKEINRIQKQLSGRPKLETAVLDDLKTWVNDELVFKEDAYGEHVSVMYFRYKSYCRLKFPDRYQEFESKIENPRMVQRKLISRRSFRPALEYILRVGGYLKEIQFSAGRDSTLSGVELKRI